MPIEERRTAQRLLAQQAAVLERIAKGEPLADILHAIVRFLEAGGDGVVGAVHMVEPGTERLWLGAAPGLPEALEGALHGVPLDEAGACGAAVTRGEPVVVEDLETEPLCAPFAALAIRGGLRACWAVPVYSSSTVPLAACSMFYRDSRRPETAELQRMGIAADLAGVAIERHQADEERQRSAREWLLTFDSIESPVLVVDTRCRIVRLNEAGRRLAGLSFADLVDAPLSLAGAREPWRGLRVAVESALATRQASTSTVFDPEAGTVWELSASVAGGSGVGDARVILVAKDVTQIVRLRESLARSELMAAIGSLVAGVAHEVRNPLFVITATLDAFEAASGSLGAATVKSLVSTLRDESNRLGRLMRDLLDYGRPAPPQLLRGPLRAALGVALTATRLHAERAKVTVRLHVADDLPDLLMDPSRLGQAFQNLIENAIHHSPQGGAVTIEAEVTPGIVRWLLCRVRDQGPGLREADRLRVFEPFFTRRRGGTGLGLSIVQRIVEQHGGTILAENAADGGAVFTMRLPLDR